MREEVINTIRLHKLEINFISKISNVSRGSVYKYIGNEHKINKYYWTETKIEESVIEWRDEMYKKRQNLLKNTRYAHFY